MVAIIGMTCICVMIKPLIKPVIVPAATAIKIASHMFTPALDRMPSSITLVAIADICERSMPPISITTVSPAAIVPIYENDVPIFAKLAFVKKYGEIKDDAKIKTIRMIKMLNSVPALFRNFFVFSM